VKFIENLQNKPERERKIILWVVIIIIGLILGTVWILGISNNVKRLRSTDIQENLNLPEMPNLEL